MKFYIYKTKKPYMFEPEGSLLPVFTVPVKQYKDTFVLVFQDKPSKNVKEEYDLTYSMEVEECENLEELKSLLKTKDFWRLNILF